MGGIIASLLTKLLPGIFKKLLPKILGGFILKKVLGGALRGIVGSVLGKVLGFGLFRPLLLGLMGATKLLNIPEEDLAPKLRKEYIKRNIRYNNKKLKKAQNKDDVEKEEEYQHRVSNLESQLNILDNTKKEKKSTRLNVKDMLATVASSVIILPSLMKNLFPTLKGTKEEIDDKAESLPTLFPPSENKEPEPPKEKNTLGKTLGGIIGSGAGMLLGSGVGSVPLSIAGGMLGSKIGGKVQSFFQGKPKKNMSMQPTTSSDNVSTRNTNMFALPKQSVNIVGATETRSMSTPKLSPSEIKKEKKSTQEQKKRDEREENIQKDLTFIKDRFNEEYPKKPNTSTSSSEENTTVVVLPTVVRETIIKETDDPTLKYQRKR